MTLELLGLNVNTEPKTELLKEIGKRLDLGKKTFIVTPYSEFFYFAAQDYQFRKIINEADFSLPDGISILWLNYFLSLPLNASNYYLKILEGFWQGFYSGLVIIFQAKKLRKQITEKISGSDFFWDLIKLAEQRKLRVYFLGGFDQTPELVAKKVLLRFPDLQISGYSNAAPTSDPVDQINLAETDLLFVAYGPVKQEKWIHTHLDNLKIRIAIGVGGTFDYIAGVRLSPPAVVRKIGLEWLYRLITQPERFKRIWHATVSFTLGALRYKVFTSLPFRKNVVGVIINEENKIFVGLRAQRKSGLTFTPSAEQRWQLPQGGVEKAETGTEAIIREMREETNLKEIKILGFADNHYQYDWQHFFRKLFRNSYRFRGQDQQIIYISANSKDPNNEVHLDQNEFSEYKWIEPEQLKATIEEVRSAMLEIVLNDLPKYL